MTLQQQIAVREKTKAEALSLLKNDFARHWFRRTYNLPPTDERYLKMTDHGIHVEFYIHQELQRREEEHRQETTPHCSKCKYEGPPFPQTTLCPACGAEMIIPKGESDQATYADDDFETTVQEELGIDLPDELKT